ncbi:MAG: SurA N-terminal domain-containing protein [Candidatus Aminicenantes bacterium]
MKFEKKVSISCVFLSVLIFGVSAFCQASSQDPAEQPQEEQEVVATIDGEEIYKAELDQMTNLQQLMLQIQQQNPQFVRFLSTSPEGQNFLEAFERNQLDDLIARKLLEREVEREDINLTEADKEKYFQEQIDLIKQQQNMSDDDLLQALSQQGIESMDQFKEIFLTQQSEDLKIHKLMETVILDKVDISDEDAKELYDQGQYQMDFEEIKDQIKMELAQQKYIEKLKEDTEIKILLS